MSTMASQITSLTIVYSTVYSRRKSQKTSKLRVTGLCEGNSPVTGEFPTQGASNAENVSIWWRNFFYHVPLFLCISQPLFFEIPTRDNPGHAHEFRVFKISMSAPYVLPLSFSDYMQHLVKINRDISRVDYISTCGEQPVLFQQIFSFFFLWSHPTMNHGICVYFPFHRIWHIIEKNNIFQSQTKSHNIEEIQVHLDNPGSEISTLQVYV